MSYKAYLTLWPARVKLRFSLQSSFTLPSLILRLNILVFDPFLTSYSMFCILGHFRAFGSLLILEHHVFCPYSKPYLFHCSQPQLDLILPLFFGMQSVWLFGCNQASKLQFDNWNCTFNVCVTVTSRVEIAQVWLVGSVWFMFTLLIHLGLSRETHLQIYF